MSKNLVINGVTYNGIESMEIPNTEGEKVVFVPEDESGVNLPELTNPAGADDIVLGKEAIDADGNVITGKIVDDGVGATLVVGASESEEQTITWGGVTYLTSANFSGTVYGDQVVRSGSKVTMGVPGSEFGDAAAEDVAAGKVFTSVHGLKVVGTAEASAAATARMTMTAPTSKGPLYYFSPNYFYGVQIEQGQSLTDEVPVGAFCGVMHSAATYPIVTGLPVANYGITLNGTMTVSYPELSTTFDALKMFIMPPNDASLEFR